MQCFPEKKRPYDLGQWQWERPLTRRKTVRMVLSTAIDEDSWDVADFLAEKQAYMSPCMFFKEKNTSNHLAHRLHASPA